VDRKSAQPQLRTSTVLWTSVLSRMAHAECTGARFGLASSSAMPKVPAPASAQHHLRPNTKAATCSRGATSPRAPFSPTRRWPASAPRPSAQCEPARAPPSAQRDGGLLRRQVRQQPNRAQRTAGTPNSKMLTLCVPAPELAAQVVRRYQRSSLESSLPSAQ